MIRPGAADPSRAEGLLRRWGQQAIALRCVARSDSEIWRVRTARGSDLALRIFAADRQDSDAIDVELDWLHELAASGLFVPAPLATPEGQLRVSFDEPGPSLTRRHAALLAWLPGRTLFAGLRPVHLRRVGVLIAQFHDSAARLCLQGRIPTHRPVFGPDLAAWADGRRRLPAWIGKKLTAQLPKVARQLHERIETWPRDGEHWSWIHGDLHPWNLLFHQGRAGAIDFSDGGWGFLAQDLAGVLQFLRFPLPGHHDHRHHFDELRAALFEGYAATRPLAESLLEQAAVLTVMRPLGTLQWMLDDWRSPDDRPWGRGFIADLPEVLEQANA